MTRKYLKRDSLNRMRSGGATPLALIVMENELFRYERRRDELFTALLHAVYMVQLCQKINPNKDIGQQIGELDWIGELHRVWEVINASS